MILRTITLSLVAAFVIPLTDATSQSFFTGIEQISLNAARSANIWTASGYNASNGKEIRVAATVPGGIYSDLEDNDVLASAIYHEYNDVENRWVGRMNWTYSRTFTVTNSLFRKSKVVMVCEGLDTVAQLFINDVLVGRSQNMFARYIFDIKSALRVGENSIRVEFQSPVEYAQAQFKEHEMAYGYPVFPQNIVPEFRGEPKAQMIRKMQSSFSWDWGPSYPNSGIWKNIYVEGYDGAVIRDVLIYTTPSNPIPDETANTLWKVTARVYYDCGENDQLATLTFHRIGQPGMAKQIRMEKGQGMSVDISLTELGSDTDLWWPNGYGEQNLYWYNVSLASIGEGEASTRLIRFGFRTIELNEEFVDPANQNKGREFYFRVNGVPMYSKGSNSIPLHVLPERITVTQTEWLLRAAKMSHQNMIRIWGGGMYETDEFYDWADEYGILIWEDFMFACALYPATEEFLANVRHEVETQVKRLQYRTSLAMWAGNNENEGALRSGWWGVYSKFDAYKEDYVTLYIDTIQVLIQELDPSRNYIPSSPTNGKKTEEEGGLAENPNDLKYGDLHFYNYYSDNWDWKTFRRTRYASEYGYQSFPHYDTLAVVADDITSWTWDSPMMSHRQRHPGGQREIRDFIKMHFPFPTNYNSVEAFPYMLYMAQLTQAMGQKTQTEFYRRLQDKMDPDGTGHNMGALYWQLNDIWEGCSWASVEINGRWKLLMYYAVKFFAPVLASPYRLTNGDVVVELISDSVQEFSGNLLVEMFKLDSLTPVYQRSVPVEAEFLRSKEVFRISNTVLKQHECDGHPESSIINPCVVYITLPGTPDNFLFLQYPKNKLSLKNPNHQVIGVSNVDSKTIKFNLTTQAVAPFVFLTVRGDHRGYFSDNGFLLVSPQKEMTYYSENGISPQNFWDSLEIMSLYDVTAVTSDPIDTRKQFLEQRNLFDSDNIFESFESESNSYETLNLT